MMVKITRRAALAGAALLTASMPTATQAEADQHADAALILMGERLNAAWSRWDLIAEKCRGRSSTAEEEAEYDAAYEECGNIVKAIETTKARSLEGLRVKAQAISWCYCGDEIDFRDGQDTVDLRLVNSIVRALLEV